MQVSNSLAPGGATDPSAQPAGKNALGKDDFLRLLTTQLANQDPLDPMDNTAFVSQMAEFSTLEHMMNMSESVGQLAVAQAVSNGTNMVGLIGKEVAFGSDQFNYQPPEAQPIGVQLEGPAEEITLTVYDAEGNLVRTIDAKGPFDAGSNTIEWDGTDNDGSQMPAGEYSVKVSARGADDANVQASLMQRGVVTGVTYESGFPELLIGEQRVPVGSISEVIEPGSDQRDSNAVSDSDKTEFVSVDTAQPYRAAR